jgi:hypothetical protein
VGLAGYVLFDSFTRATGIRRAWLRSRSTAELLQLIAMRRRVIERPSAKGPAEYFDDIRDATDILLSRGLSPDEISSGQLR